MKILSRFAQKTILNTLAELVAMAYPEAKRMDKKEYLSALTRVIAFKVGGQEGFLDVQNDFLKYIEEFGYEDETGKENQ